MLFRSLYVNLGLRHVGRSVLRAETLYVRNWSRPDEFEFGLGILELIWAAWLMDERFSKSNPTEMTIAGMRLQTWLGAVAAGDRFAPEKGAVKDSALSLTASQAGLFLSSQKETEPFRNMGPATGIIPHKLIAEEKQGRAD